MIAIPPGTGDAVGNTSAIANLIVINVKKEISSKFLIIVDFRDG